MVLALEVLNLHSGYNKNLVVRDVSFNINLGEIVGLVGLNGAGKTTLIKTILGLRDKISGEVSLCDEKRTAYLPEKFEPSYFLSGEKFIQFSLSLYGKKISSEEISEFAKMVSFDPNFLQKNVSSYSKGMKQKIGLLSTFISQCPLTVLDEPMSGLDPKARREVKTMITSARDRGQSVLMSSHVLADISELCDRILIFHDNQIIFEGTPLDLLRQGDAQSPEEAFLSIIDNGS